jgi:hypothetical protein
MTKKKESGEGDETIRGEAAGGKLTPQARRALEEAEARRAVQKEVARKAQRAKKEIGGGDGLEPIRYGDWEVKGRVSDF